MIVKTIQNRKVLETLLSNKIHFSKRDKIDNLTEPYKKMSEYYNWGSNPIFCCEVGRYSNFYGANYEDAVLLTLDVPDDIVKRQIYYDWSDVVYYTEFPNEWEYGTFDKFVAEVLNGVGTDDQHAIIQVTIPFIWPEFLVKYEDITAEFIDKYIGNGGSAILE